MEAHSCAFIVSFYILKFSDAKLLLHSTYPAYIIHIAACIWYVWMTADELNYAGHYESQ